MGLLAIGADIGGSHISCGLVDLEKRRLLSRTIINRKVDNQADADDIMKVWSQALKDSLKGHAPEMVAGIGFAMPGPFDYVKGIGLFKGRPKYHKLHKVNVAQRIRQLMLFDPSHPVRFMNDATSFAVGETWTGKAVGYRQTLFITLGTGFGSAFLQDGIPVVEGDSVPPMGCVWHLPYKEGISDDYFSTRWIVRRYDEITGITASGVKEIVDHMRTEPETRNIFSEFGENLGAFLSPWITRFRADILVIGGNIANAYPYYKIALQESLEKRKINIIIEVSELKERAALIGSARLLEEFFWDRVKPLLSKM